MSIWTHIVGAIRVNGLPGLHAPNPSLGKTCTFDSESWEWDACDVPKGSEGSLQIEFYPVVESHMNRGQFLIWGDLRDFDTDDLPGLIHWMNGIPETLKKQKLSVRDAVIQIEVEGTATISVFTFGVESGKWLCVNIKDAEIF